MKSKNKILSDAAELNSLVTELKTQHKKIVLCQGHFNVIHPGHLRFLEFAKSHGDHLIVALQGEHVIEQSVRDKFFTVEERARSVASLELVDSIFVFDTMSFEEVIDEIKPNFYVMGEEFAKKDGEIKEYIVRVEKWGGKVMFSSGEVRYSSTELLDKDFFDIKTERMLRFRDAIKKQSIDSKKLLDYCDEFHEKHILVIGDSIVDQYVVCDALGMSSEAPVLVVRELEQKQFVGGAAVVARHLRALGAQCSFLSVIGDDAPGKVVKESLIDDNINANFLVDNERPTTFKIRYMVGLQKMFRVSRLKDHHVNQDLEKDIIDHLSEIASTIDGIIVSDFSYGLITHRILGHIARLSEKYNIKLLGDTQSSSQVANVLKFEKYYCLTPTEKEARIALDDNYSGLEALGTNLLKRSGSKNVILTLSGNGFIVFQSTEQEGFLRTQHFPALNPNPVDVVGAGDSLLTAIAASTCVGANIMEASVIGAATASIAVDRVGNVPVSIQEVKECLQKI